MQIQKNSRTFASLLKTSALEKEVWRDGRVVDCGGLENRCTARYRGFESLSLRKKKQVKFSNLFEEFYLLFFVRRLAAARGWTCQSLSLRLEVVNLGFATSFFMLLLNIPYLFLVLLSKKELEMNRYEWKVKWEWVMMLLIVILVWALCMHC